MLVSRRHLLVSELDRGQFETGSLRRYLLVARRNWTRPRICGFATVGKNRVLFSYVAGGSTDSSSESHLSCCTIVFMSKYCLSSLILFPSRITTCAPRTFHFFPVGGFDPIGPVFVAVQVTSINTLLPCAKAFVMVPLPSGPAALRP